MLGAEDHIACGSPYLPCNYGSYILYACSALFALVYISVCQKSGYKQISANHVSVCVFINYLPDINVLSYSNFILISSLEHKKVLFYPYNESQMGSNFVFDPI